MLVTIKENWDINKYTSTEKFGNLVMWQRYKSYERAAISPEFKGCIKNTNVKISNAEIFVFVKKLENILYSLYVLNDTQQPK